MARPKKIENNVVDQTPTIQELMAQLMEMTKKVEELQSSQNLHAYAEDDELNEENEIKINPDDYIKVMSLVHFRLNLTTEAKGQGRPFRFTKFGEVKRILYSDLIRIVENHANFLNDGYFVILNKNVVRKLGLNDVYAKILTKEKIERILEGNQSDAVNLFNTANKGQQEVIVKQIIERATRGFDTDLNLLFRLSQIIGYDIQEKINDAKSFASMMESEKNQ